MKLTIEIITLSVIMLTLSWVGFEKARAFYQENFPLGPSGACYDVRYPDFKTHYKMEIINNDLDDHSSFVALTLLNDKSTFWEDKYSFDQLRMLNPVRMECK